MIRSGAGGSRCRFDRKRQFTREPPLTGPATGFWGRDGCGKLYHWFSLVATQSGGQGSRSFRATGEPEKKPPTASCRHCRTGTSRQFESPSPFQRGISFLLSFSFFPYWCPAEVLCSLYGAPEASTPSLVFFQSACHMQIACGAFFFFEMMLS